MPVNDVNVRRIIDDYLKKHGGVDDRWAADHIRAAWEELKEWRDAKPSGGKPANSLDLDHAAAENYLYARSEVAVAFVSEAQMHVLAVGNYAAKRVGIKMPSSKNPQSEPDLDVLRWGSIGAREGEADRIRYRPKEDAPLWRPVNEVFPLLPSWLRGIGAVGSRYPRG
ncbi:hypothetical protein ACFJIX_14205 [Roseateles sp. UC29_93]|uniref:hypothetical protein n=1 Tax=Roseateles sp. UC29_93 TaxID=3350177 RepID=UPI00366F96FF